MWCVPVEVGQLGDRVGWTCPRCWKPGTGEAKNFPHKIRRPCRIEGEGLGDRVAAVTKAAGVPPCGCCKERQRILNEVGDTLQVVADKAVGAVRGIILPAATKTED